MDFIVKPGSINYASIRADVVAWLDSKPDAQKWAVFFQSSAGQGLIDLIAGLVAFFQYETIVARREAYIPYAENRSSVIGGAQFLGYSAFRGRNAIVSLTIVPATTGVWTKWEDIGAVKDRRLIITETTPHNAGIPITVTCIIGEVLTETVIAENANLNSFRFKTSGVSSDCRIYVDSVEVDWAENVIDLLDGKFVLQSNVLGSVDAKYLNLLGYQQRYDTNSEIKLEWISLKEVDFQISDITLDVEQGTLSSLDIVSIYSGVEAISSIQVNAPLKNETKNAVRGRRDQPKIFTQLDSKVVDCAGDDVSAAIMIIFLLMENDFRLTSAEKQILQDKFSPYRPLGLLPPIIADAIRAKIKLKITVYPEAKPVGNINTIIEELRLDQINILGSQLSLLDFEQNLESTDYVKVARIELTADAWSSNTQYEKGEMVKAIADNGRIYQVKRILYFSGSTEPIWPVTVDVEVQDSQIVWKAIPKNDLAGVSAWSPSTEYVVGNLVKPSSVNGFVYQAVGYLNKSGVSEPSWPALAGQTPAQKQGSKVIDNNIVWMARPQEGTVVAWSVSTEYKVGDLVKATNQTSSDTIGVMFQAYALTGKSNSSSPSFPTNLGALYKEGHLEWICLDPKADTLTAEEMQYFDITVQTTVM